MDVWNQLPSFGTLLLIGLPLAYVLGIPLIILTTFRAEAFPTIETLGPEVALPEAVRQKFFADHEAMASLGFSNEGTYFMPEAFANVKALMVVFFHPEDEVGAVSMVTYGNINGQWQIQSQHTEFCTDFSDETSIGTSNQKTVGSFPPREGSMLTIHPSIQNLAELYTAHKAMVRRHIGNRRIVNKCQERFGGDMAAFLSAGMTQEFEQAKRCGYVKYQGGNQSEFSRGMQASPYRPPSDVEKPKYAATFKGAYLMTWRELWPFKSMVTRLRVRRDAKLLHQAVLS